MTEDNPDDLRRAIFDLHSTQAEWLEAIPVTETFRGKTVWAGTVHVFKLLDHPTATRCYAWSHEVEGSTKRRYVAVLHQETVDSPQAAVRAAIIQESD